MTSDATQEKRIAIYCRVSTDEQAKEGVSLDEQHTRLTAYCRAMGWRVEVMEFIDDGYSAKDTERPALQKLLREIRHETVSKLMVTKLDRLSRRLLDLLTLIDLFHQHHVTFVSTSESFDTDTPSGRLTLQVLGAVAEFERERIRERVFENMLHAAKSGRWLTQHPYGYRLEHGKLVVYEPEAVIVRRVFHEFITDGFGFFAIAKRLNQEKIPSRRNKDWSIRAIKLMLTNPAYIGTLMWNRVDSSKKKRELKSEEQWVEIGHVHPAIIDSDTWQQVQMKIRNTPLMPAKAKASPHLLGGLLRCGKCGASMTIGWSGYPKRHRVYRCSAYRNKGTCESKPYRADEVEQWFLIAMHQLLDSMDKSVHQVTIKQVPLELMATFKQKREVVKNRYARQVEAYTAGLIEIDALAQEKSRRDLLIAEIEMQMVNLGQKIGYLGLEGQLQGKAQNIVDSIYLLPIEIAKAKLRTVIHSVVLLGEADLEMVLSMNCSL